MRYVKGDATEPIGNDKKIIAHICNNFGLWGAGFVLAISKKWAEPEDAYLSLDRHVLGHTQFVHISEDLTVANMIAQNGVIGKHNPHPLVLSSLSSCLANVQLHALLEGRSVHMPRIGCGLAGGKWSDVEPIIKQHLTDKGVDVIIYDLEK